MNLESSLTYFKYTNLKWIKLLVCLIHFLPDYYWTFLIYLLMLLFVLLIWLFSTASFPVAFKSAVVNLLFKNPTLYCDILKNCCPVSNLPYLSKLIEKVITIRLVEHMRRNAIMETFQSAYKAHHYLYNDGMFNIDRGNVTLLVFRFRFRFWIIVFLLQDSSPLTYILNYYDLTIKQGVVLVKL